MVTAGYKFQGLLTLKVKEGVKHVEGPMSPVLAAKAWTEHMKIKLHGLVRVWGDDIERYDHLIIKTNWTRKGKPVQSYHMFIDMGVKTFPVGSWFTHEEKAYIPDIYKEIIGSEANLQRLRDDLEMPKWSRDSPVIQVDEDSFVDLCKQAEESGEFKIIGDDK